MTQQTKPAAPAVDLAALAGEPGQLFTAAPYLNKDGTSATAAVRVNANGCGWSSIPVKAIALILTNPQLVTAAVAAAIKAANDPATIADLQAKKAAKGSKKTAAPPAATTAANSATMEAMIAALSQ